MEELLKLLKKIKPEVNFEGNEHLIDNEELDSFDIVSLISEINHEFDVAIPAEEIIPENFNSAEALYSLIERLQDED